MSEKPKVAFYWCAACGGCDEAVVDLAEGILDVVAAVDIVLWPVAMDFKKADIEARADKSILVSFINGSIRSSEQVEWVRLLRKKSQLVISFGTCAGGGGIPALANEFSREEILKYVYETCPSNVNESKVRPGPTPVAHNGDGSALTLPELHEQVRSLDQVIAVDYYLPGCPPTPKIIAAAVGALLSGKMPPPGTVLSPDTALCNECRRKDSKPAALSLTEFTRPHRRRACATRERRSSRRSCRTSPPTSPRRSTRSSTPSRTR